MMQKKLIKVGGRYVERYVDMGKSRAVLNHGRPISTRGCGGGRRQFRLSPTMPRAA